MEKSISAKSKKLGRPATGTEPLYSLRISDEFMGRIEKWARENSATRSEAIRRLVELGLKAKR
jgi:predicted DNA-binding protein